MVPRNQNRALNRRSMYLFFSAMNFSCFSNFFILGRELKMEINGYLTDESMKNANITVDINGKVVTHHLIRVAEISLKFENLKGDRKVPLRRLLLDLDSK